MKRVKRMLYFGVKTCDKILIGCRFYFVDIIFHNATNSLFVIFGLKGKPLVMDRTSRWFVWVI